MHLKEPKASRIITLYCRKLHDQRMYADDFNKKLKAGITAKVEYHAFALCSDVLYKRVYTAFKKEFPDIYDIVFGVTRTHIHVKQTHKNKTVEYYAIENKARKLFEEVTDDCKVVKNAGSLTKPLSFDEVLDIIEKYCRRSFGHGTEMLGKKEFKVKLGMKIQESDLNGYQYFSVCPQLADRMSKAYPTIHSIEIALTESHVLVKLRTFTKSGNSARKPEYFALKHEGAKVYNDIMDKNPITFRSCDIKERPWFLRWLPL